LDEYGQLSTVITEYVKKQGDNPILQTLLQLSYTKLFHLVVTYVLEYAKAKKYFSDREIEKIANAIETEVATKIKRATLGKSTAALE
jgi:hypothetical protein